MADDDIEMKDETIPSINKENSKLPFVEKYRPDTLDQIISQDDIIKTLKKPFKWLYNPPPEPNDSNSC